MESDKEETSTCELIGVHVHRSDLVKAGFFLRRPAVTVHIFDKRSGQCWSKSGASESSGSGWVEPVSSKCYDIIEHRAILPCWDELLILDEKASKLHHERDAFLMFEMTDVQQIRNKTFDRIRIAWAFLVPRASDGSLNLNKELRLQLYKIRKNCKISHQTCDLFHFYSKHDLKKHLGSLYVTVKEVKQYERGLQNVAAEPEQQPEEKAALTENPQDIKPNLMVYQWSRLPTQSCKVPNKTHKSINVGRKGASCVQFSKTGSYVAFASMNRIAVYHAMTGEEIASLNGHNGLIYELDWSEDDRYLLSASNDCASAIWSLNPVRKTPIFILPHPSFVYCGQWFGSSEQLVTGCKDHMIRHWTKVGDSFELIEEIGGHLGFVSALATQDNAFVFSGDSTGCVMIRKFTGSKWILLKKLTFYEISQNVIDSIHLHPGRRRILLTLRARGSFMVDTSAGVIIQTYKAMVNISARSTTCLTPCGSLVFSFCQSGDVYAWEVNTGKLVATYDKLFPIERLTELSGSINYHPFEHMIVFAVLGDNYPVLLLKYENTNDDSKKLGLVFKQADGDVEDTSAGNVKSVLKSGEAVIALSVTENNKLASLVRKIDQVFAIKRQGENDWSQ